MYMRHHAGTWDKLKKIAKVSDDDAMNIMLSNMGKLLYREDDSASFTKAKIRLNHIGETVAQDEFDRRFDMYYTRVMSLAALVLSVVSAIITMFYR